MVTLLTSLLGRIRGPVRNPEADILARYRQLRPELLPGSSIVLRTTETGDSFIQACANCGSLDLEVGEWLGEAIRCRECNVILLPRDDGSLAIQPTAWSRPVLPIDSV